MRGELFSFHRFYISIKQNYHRKQSNHCKYFPFCIIFFLISGLIPWTFFSGHTPQTGFDCESCSDKSALDFSAWAHLQLEKLSSSFRWFNMSQTETESTCSDLQTCEPASVWKDKRIKPVSWAEKGWPCSKKKKKKKRGATARHLREKTKKSLKTTK